MNWFGKIFSNKPAPRHKRSRPKSSSSRRLALTIAAVGTSLAFVASIAQTSRAETGSISAEPSESSAYTSTTVSIETPNSDAADASELSSTLFQPTTETTIQTSPSSAVELPATTEPQVTVALDNDQTIATTLGEEPTAPGTESTAQSTVAPVTVGPLPVSTLGSAATTSTASTAPPSSLNSSAPPQSTSSLAPVTPTLTTLLTTSSLPTTTSSIPESGTSTTVESSTTSTIRMSTSTTVAGTPPRSELECAWVIADADAKASNGMQYAESSSGAGVNDPMKPTGPCVVSADSALQARYGRHALRVNPIGDLGTGRMIELWVLSSTVQKTPPAPEALTWKLSEPNGKIAQSGATNVRIELVCGAPESTNAPPSTGSLLSSMAIAAGSQLVASADGSASVSGLLTARCAEPGILLAHHRLQLDPQSPCGEYQLETSIHKGDVPEVKTLTIDIDCVTAFSFDFVKLRWPELATGENLMLGDTTFGGELPTVRNTGNVGITVRAIFEKFHITNQSAIGPGIPANGNGSGSIPAIDPLPRESITAWVSRTVPVGFTAITPAERMSEVLCPGETGSFNVAVVAADGARSGNYAGAMSLVADRWFQKAQNSTHPNVTAKTGSSSTSVPTAKCAEDQDSLTPAWSE